MAGQAPAPRNHCLAALRYYCYRMFGDPCDRISTSGLQLPNHGVATANAAAR